LGRSLFTFAFDWRIAALAPAILPKDGLFPMKRLVAKLKFFRNWGNAFLLNICLKMGRQV
jgi:hypothetical protein